MQYMTNKQRRRAAKTERRKQERIQREHLAAAGTVPTATPGPHEAQQQALERKRDRTGAIMEIGLATGEEVALYLGVHVKTVERWRRRLALPWLRLGGRVRYRLQDVAYWASARKEGE